jgi:hypothetical protein
MSWISKQSGNTAQNSTSVGTQFITANGSTLPVAPATFVSGTTYTIAETFLPFGFYMIEVQLDITGDDTTYFEAIQVTLRNGNGIILYDNWLVGTTLKSTAQIELNGTYPVYIGTDPSAGDFKVQIIPTFTGTAPTCSGLIRPFKVV